MKRKIILITLIFLMFFFMKFEIIAEEYKPQIFYLDQEVTEKLEFYGRSFSKLSMIRPTGLEWLMGYEEDFLVNFEDISNMLDLNIEVDKNDDYISIKAYNDKHKFYLDNKDNTTYLMFSESISRYAEINDEYIIEIRKDFYNSEKDMSALREDYSIVYYILNESESKDGKIYIPILNFLGLLEYELNVNINDDDKADIINIKHIKSEKIREEIKDRYDTIFEEVINSPDFNYNRAERVLEYLENKQITLNDDEIKNMFLGDIWFGMTKEQFKVIKGKPNQINIIYHTKDTLHEQWVYGVTNMRFYYFENGILTTIQRF